MQDQRGITWCDYSVQPERTAGYLQRLSKLHDNLIQTETVQLSKVMSSFPKIHSPSNNQIRRKQTSSNGIYDSAPNLHARKQIERTLVIDRRRRAAVRSPPPLTIAVKQIEDPVKQKDKAEKKDETPPKDPFDPANLEPDPLERLFNMEKLRLLNAALAKKNEIPGDSKDKKIKIKVRQNDLLTPRRGNEWFITGRYKKEPRKQTRPKVPKHKKDRTRKLQHRPPNLSACNSLKTDSNSEHKSSTRESESSVGEVRLSTAGTEKENRNSYNAPTTTPIHWDQDGPGTVPVDSTANIMLAIASTAEANKAETKSRILHYDPNNYRPIGTPKSSPHQASDPIEGTASSSSMTKYEDLRRSKVIAAVLQGSVDENGESYQAYESTLKKRHTSEQSIKIQKGLQVGVKGRGLVKLETAIKVPISSSPFEGPGIDSTRSLQDSSSGLEVVSVRPSTGEKTSEPLFIPARKSQPHILLRHSSPELVVQERVQLNKIVRQNELRQRELGNLFEDIKELNRVSENLKEQTPDKKEEKK